MNIESPRPLDDREDREWQAQECAVEHERRHVGNAGDDARVRGYRALVRVLAQPLPDGLPPDFALRLARRAERAIGDDSVERFRGRLLLALVGVFGIATASIVMLYGNDWFEPLLAMLRAGPDASRRWLLLFAACGLLSAFVPAPIRKRARELP